MAKIKLKLTRKKPSVAFNFEDHMVYYKYLYTNTGLVKNWTVAMNLYIRKDEEPPKEITIDIRKVDENDT